MDIRTIATAGYNFYSEVIEPAYIQISLPEADGEYLDGVRLYSDYVSVSPVLGGDVLGNQVISSSDNLIDRPHVNSECLKPKIRADVV